MVPGVANYIAWRLTSIPRRLANPQMTDRVRTHTQIPVVIGSGLTGLSKVLAAAD